MPSLELPRHAASRVTHAVVIIGMMVFGTHNTLNTKWQFATCAPTIPDDRGQDRSSRMLYESQSQGDEAVVTGCPPGQTYFNKPWMQNWAMFFGESALLPTYYLSRSWSARKRRLVGKEPREPDSTPMYLFAIPAFCDVFGSGIAGVGLMFISSSVWQMIRGSIIVFTALLSVIFLGRRLYTNHYIGLASTVAGLTLVSYAAVADSSDTNISAKAHNSGNSQAAFGITLVLLAQVCAASQCVFEEYLLQGRRVSAKRTVGLEGIWGILFQGVLIVVFAYLPGSDHGHYQDIADAEYMYTRPGSRNIVILTVIYMASIAMYNLCGLKVTQGISAVMRCLIDGCRTVAVWAVSLSLYYSGYEEYGSPWTPHSGLQLVGFVLLIFGTLIYNSAIRMPCLSRRHLHEDEPPTVYSSPKVGPTKGMDDMHFSPPMSPVTPVSTSPGMGSDMEHYQSLEEF